MTVFQLLEEVGMTVDLIEGRRAVTRVKHAAETLWTSVFVPPSVCTARRTGSDGTIGAWVPGHDGDLVWFKHDDDGTVGIYWTDELELTNAP